MNADLERARLVFLDAVENHTPEQWSAFLDETCGRELNLRHRVEVLLRAHADSNSLLDRPAPGVAVNDLAREGPSTVIGPYKLVEQIGEGGFGIVYRAEQQQPVRRLVALKILKPGMDTHQVVARFEAERQALALMNHANIAHVLDGGETASGRPYFVMDLVNGVPITEHCDQARLNTRERLKLFVSVCQAVQHAHQKGIIHRDLKPTNVLVTQDSETPTVKVIDFGIAKAVGRDLTEKTFFTQTSQLVGTPLYMSPEQAALSGIDVDTRTDIYSLGVLLYELLTGTTPFDKESLLQAGYDEMRRIIREEEPPKPSTRVCTLSGCKLQNACTDGASRSPYDVTAVAARRRSDPRKLRQLLSGELDWIVMKCLEKDRSRRYETASALAADVERYLHDEPVQACPPSALYRFRKLARRHRAALWTASCVVAALIAALAMLVQDMARKNALTQRALDAEMRVRKETEENFQAARSAVDKFFTFISGSRLNEVPVMESLRQQMLLDTALEYYQGFIDRHRDDRELQAEVAAAHIRLAEITYLAGGSPADWFSHLRDGIELIEQLIQEQRDTPDVQRRLAKLYLGGDPPRMVADHPVPYEDVQNYLKRELSIWQKFILDNPGVPEFQNDYAGTCYYLATSYGFAKDALVWSNRAIEAWEKLARAHPAVSSYRFELARAYEQRGRIWEQNGNTGRANESLRRARALRQDLSREQIQKIRR
jgi:serine/threonine protein kinase